VPSTFSPEFIDRVRQPPPPPFIKWQNWQRRFFGWGVGLVWLILVGGSGIYLVVLLQLPGCGAPRTGMFHTDCHTTVAIGLCVSALVALYFLYLRFLVLVSQIVYIPKPNYGVAED
jgi:hypothetical protein